MVRIVFYIHSFSRFGGAERVITILLQCLDRAKFDIFLLMAKKEGRYLSEIPSDIKIIDLRVSKTVLAVPKIAKTIGRLQPDIFFCIRSLVLGFSTKIFRLFSPKTKYIVREVIIPSEHNRNEPFPVLFNIGYRFIYPWFDKIICQSDDMVNDLIVNFKIDSDKLIKIHNPVNLRKIKPYLRLKHDCKNDNQIDLLAVGRLTRQKGFDLLIDAFALLDERFHLTILGEGELMCELKKKSFELKLSNRIDFVGFVEEPYPYMLKSDIFVLSSRYEGLPNILLEVMSCGLPVVAFECLGGVNEIIIPYENGLLVPNGDIEALAVSILEASSLSFNSQKIKDSVRVKFDCGDRVADYENLFRQCCTL